MLTVCAMAGKPAFAIPYAWAGVAIFVLILSLDTLKLVSFSLIAGLCWYVHNCTTLEAEFQLSAGFFKRMEQQASNLLAVLKNSNVPLDIKLDLLDKLKAFIKHHAVPENAINVTFDVLRLTMSSSQLQDSGFSMLSHMTKRMVLQEQEAILAHQGSKTYGVILDRLGDSKDRVQLRAIQSLMDFWSASPMEVESLIKDKALGGKNVRAKQAAMQWVLRMHNEQSLPFKSFVPKIVQCLEDADGIVRDTAKAAIIELFKPASEAAQADLQKQMSRFEVRSIIVDHISSQLGLGKPSSARPASADGPPVRTPSSEATVRKSFIPSASKPKLPANLSPPNFSSAEAAVQKITSLLPVAKTVAKPALSLFLCDKVVVPRTPSVLPIAKIVGPPTTSMISVLHKAVSPACSLLPIKKAVALPNPVTPHVKTAVLPASSIPSVKKAVVKSTMSIFSRVKRAASPASSIPSVKKAVVKSTASIISRVKRAASPASSIPSVKNAVAKSTSSIFSLVKTAALPASSTPSANKAVVQSFTSKIPLVKAAKLPASSNATCGSSLHEARKSIPGPTLQSVLRMKFRKTVPLQTIRKSVSFSSDSSYCSYDSNETTLQHSVTSSISSLSHNPKPTPSHTPARSRDNIVPIKGKKSGPVPPSIDSADAVAPPVAATVKAELDPAKPIHIESNGYFHLNRHLTADNKDRTVRLDEQCRDMLPLFEGKESEHNWVIREKYILILRKITKGNAPTEFTVAYIAMIKGLTDGILKSVNSLRTTVSTNGCFLVQEIARAIGSGLDPMVEMIMQTLIKVCGHTKTINAQNGNATVTQILGNVTYSTRLLQHVLNACTDKNVRPRSYSQGWLKLIITRHINHQHVLEHGNGIDMMEKVLQKGLADPDAGVRESARDAYWAFNTLWPNRGEVIMAGLKAAAQGQLLQHPANPNPSSTATQFTHAVATKPSLLSRSTTASITRPSLKETMLAKKREKATTNRPDSAQALISPVRPQPPRPATSMSIGTLSSAPLRPIRPKSAKKAEEFKIPMKPAVKKPSAPSPSKAAEELTMIIPSMSASAPELPYPSTRRYSPTSQHFPAEQLDFAPTESDAIVPAIAKPEFVAFSAAVTKPESEAFIAEAGQPESDMVGAEVAQPEPEAVGAEPITEATTTKSQEETDLIYVEEKLPRIALAPVSTDVVCSRKENRKSLEAQRKSFESQRALAELSDSQTNNGNDTGDSNIVRLIDSGIKRITSKTLDAHGYRKLQSTITGNLGQLSALKLSELTAAIITRLGDDASPADDRIVSQQLMLLKLLQQGKRQTFMKYVPDVMCSILVAAGRYKEESHTITTIDNTFDQFTSMLDFPGAEVTEAVLDMIVRREDRDDDQGRHTWAHSMEGLTKLIKVSGKEFFQDRSEYYQPLLMMTLRGITSEDALIRRKAYALASQVHTESNDSDAFWTAFGNMPGSGDKSMLLYSIYSTPGQESPRAEQASG